MGTRPNPELSVKSFLVSTLPSVLVLSLVLSTALTPGCRGPEGQFGTQRPASRPVQVHVQNNNFLDVTVHARTGGRNVRLGQVSGKSSGKLTIDPRRINLSSGLQLMVDPIGSRNTFLSQAVFPDRNAVVVLEVGAQLQMSFVSLR
jgi:hypothetical protein